MLWSVRVFYSSCGLLTAPVPALLSALTWARWWPCLTVSVRYWARGDKLHLFFSLNSLRGLHGATTQCHWVAGRHSALIKTACPLPRPSHTEVWRANGRRPQRRICILPHCEASTGGRAEPSGAEGSGAHRGGTGASSRKPPPLVTEQVLLHGGSKTRAAEVSPGGKKLFTPNEETVFSFSKLLAVM